jgi:outer membrane receptor protein involved in Fe transport
VLQSVPADQVERIEVITNPSAEFRPDGSAGIINLVMKKAKGSGKTGSVRISGLTSGNYSATLSNGFNSNKLSVADSLSFSHARIRLVADYDRSLTAGGGSHELLLGGADVNSVQGRLAADYDLNPTTRLSGSVTGYWQGATQYFDDTFAQTDGAGATTIAFHRTSQFEIPGQNIQLDFTLRKKWSDTHSFTLNTAVSDNQGFNERVELTSFTTPVMAPLALDVMRNNTNKRAALTVDYQQALGGGVQLKAGYLIEYQDNYIEHAGGSGASIGAITNSVAQTDNFSDIETHNNAYVTLQKKLDKLTVLGGVRAETVHLDLNQLTPGIRSEQDYSRIYPTLHLGYALSEGRNLTASYSKRVQRPTPADLDPFLYSNNGNSAILGNPNLTPQDTDAYELGYETRKGAAFTLITVYRRDTHNAFSTVLTDLGNGVLLQSRANLGQQSNTGIEWTMGNKLGPKLTYNLSLNAYQTAISGGALSFTSVTSAFTGFGRANLNWQVTPKDFVQLNVFANGRQLLPQAYIQPVVSGNIGYRHNLNNKVSWMVVVQDPFNSLGNKLVVDTGLGHETRNQRNNTRAVSLALVWNFAGKARDAGFDFAPGGTGGAAGP